jgi:hypothetical protein
MKNVLLALALLLAGALIDRLILGKQTVEVPVEIRVPELREVILPGRVDTIRVFPRTYPRTFRDTVWREEAWDTAPAFTADLDTMLTVTATVHDGTDTLTSHATALLSLSVSYIPTEQAFNLRRLTVEPLSLRVPMRRATVGAEANRVALTAIIGSRFSTGLMLSYGGFGLGYEYHPRENVGEIRGSVTLFSF